MYENFQIAKIIHERYAKDFTLKPKIMQYVNFPMNFSYHRMIKCFYSLTNYCNLIKIQLTNLHLL